MVTVATRIYRVRGCRLQGPHPRRYRAPPQDQRAPRAVAQKAGPDAGLCSNHHHHRR
jgi:hypothetical protein